MKNRESPDFKSLEVGISELWATISTNLFVTKSLSENEILKSTSHTNRLHSPPNSFHYF